MLENAPYRFFSLVAIAFVALFSGLGAARLWDRDEPRNAGCAAEMLLRGDWIVPTFNQQLRDHKPVLLYWGQMLSYQVFGRSDWSARLPSAVAGLVTILTIAWLAGQLASSCSTLQPQSKLTIRFWTGAALATSLLFVMAGRAATPDSCLIVFSTLGIACLCVGSLANQGKSQDDRYRTSHSPQLGTLSWKWTALGYGSLGMAALAKGPVGIILPVAVIILWRMLNIPGRGSRSLVTHYFSQAWTIVSETRVVLGCLIALLIAVPWYVAVGLATDGEFLRGFFLNHNLGRAMTSKEGHDGSIFFYPAAVLVGTFPWSLWTIPIIMWACNNFRAHRVTITLATAWLFVYVGAFSVASTKLPSYVTPCYPGIALLIGGFLNDFASGAKIPSARWRRTASTLGLIALISIALVIAWLAYAETMPLVAWTTIGCVSMGALIVAGWIQDEHHRSRMIPASWLAGAVSFLVALFGLGASQASHYREDLRTLIGIQSQFPDGIWVSVGTLEPSWIYYLEQPFIELDSPNTEIARQQFWRTLNDRLVRHRQVKIVLTADTANVLELPSANQNPGTLDTNSDPIRSQIEFRTIARTKRFLRAGELIICTVRLREPVSQFAERTTKAVNR